MTTLTATDARVWIACLHCYNSGSLVGDWYAATDADHVTIDALHIDSGTVARVSCEEMWVFDHEGLPIAGECSPAEATFWGLLLAEVAEWQRDAFLAWVRAGDYSHDGNGMPDYSDFEEAFAGEWDSFTEYAEELFIDCGYSAEMPEHLAPYFDMDAWARDLAYDYTTETAACGGVYVFRNL